MKNLTTATKAGIALGLYLLTALVSGCVVTERREGYWDRDNHRYWHNHTGSPAGSRMSTAAS